MIDFSSYELERAKGFEPSTPTLARLCSTTELRPHIPKGVLVFRPRYYPFLLRVQVLFFKMFKRNFKKDRPLVNSPNYRYDSDVSKK